MQFEGEFEKQPTEKLKIRHDFSGDLSEGEAITSVTVTAIRMSNNTVVTSTVIAGSGNEFTDTYIQYGAIGGTDGEDYHITIQVSTTKTAGPSDGVILEAEHLMRVRAR